MRYATMKLKEAFNSVDPLIFPASAAPGRPTFLSQDALRFVQDNAPKGPAYPEVGGWAKTMVAEFFAMRRPMLSLTALAQMPVQVPCLLSRQMRRTRILPLRRPMRLLPLLLHRSL